MTARLAAVVLGLALLAPLAPAQGEIWIPAQRLASLPTSGAAWERLRRLAASDFGVAVGGHKDNHDVYTLGQALVAARLDDASLKARVVSNLMSAIDTDDENKRCRGAYCNALSISRNLAAYVIAADLIDFRSFDADREAVFRRWVERMITIQHKQGGCPTGLCSIPQKFERRPNNHGTMAGASWAAAAVYLGRRSDLERIATVFRGYLGEREAYAGFRYGQDLSWQADPDAPVGINPTGARIAGHDVDGVLPDDQRRGGSFTWPPPRENYVYEALQGAIVLATILELQGYRATGWGDRALLRAYEWLVREAHYPAEGDDTFQYPLVDHLYGTRFWDGTRVRHGKLMGWTDWTHAARGHAGRSLHQPRAAVPSRVRARASEPGPSAPPGARLGSASSPPRAGRDGSRGIYVHHRQPQWRACLPVPVPALALAPAPALAPRLTRASAKLRAGPSTANASLRPMPPTSPDSPRRCP